MTPGPPDDSCPHPTRRRQAFLDDLTDAQFKLLFHGEQETERMKQEKVDEQQNKQNLKQQHPNI